MSHLDILLPFGLPSAELAGDLLRVLETPALASLVGRAKSHRREEFDPFDRALPHETWIARQFGLEESTRKRGSPPVAAAAIRASGLIPDAGTWFLLHPVYLHIARDHLALANQRQLKLSEPESRALFDSVKPLLDEIDMPLLYGDAHTWFIRADSWVDLSTATPDAASGHNIDIWLPQGPSEREWRKLQNEIQMHWHSHPVNEQRESRGENPVNSAWLWGGAVTSADIPSTGYSDLFNLQGWQEALGHCSDAPVKNSSALEIISAAPPRGMIVLNQLIDPALEGDWSEWISRMHELESQWFLPISEALKAGKIEQVSLTMSHGTDLVEFISGKYSSRKFWVKPSLSRLVR